MIMVPSAYLNRNLVRSHALYTFIAVSIDKAKDNDDAELFLDKLLGLLPRMCSIIEHEEDMRIDVGARYFTLDNVGQASGFIQCAFADVHHKAVQRMFKEDS